MLAKAGQPSSTHLCRRPHERSADGAAQLVGPSAVRDTLHLDVRLVLQESGRSLLSGGTGTDTSPSPGLFPTLRIMLEKTRLEEVET